MMVHHGRIIGLAAVLVGISALGPSTRLRAQRPLDVLRLDELGELVEQDDAVALVGLGWKYFDGEGVPEDDAEAVSWWRLAADQGPAATPHVVAVPHRRGHSGRSLQISEPA